MTETAGPELDAAVAVEVMGWGEAKTSDRVWRIPGGYRSRCDFQPTKSIADAWLVVERMEQLGWYGSHHRLTIPYVA